jgi:hypothetical protein
LILEAKLNRIVIRDGDYTDETAVSRLITDAGVTTSVDLEHLTLMCNALGQMVEDDDKGHVDLFIQKKSDDCFLCVNLYTVYLTLNNAEHTLAAFQAVIDTAASMTCRAVDEEILVVQFRFTL